MRFTPIEIFSEMKKIGKVPLHSSLSLVFGEKCPYRHKAFNLLRQKYHIK